MPFSNNIVILRDALVSQKNVILRKWLLRKAEKPQRRTPTLAGCGFPKIMTRILAILACLALLLSCAPPRSNRIVVGCKNFTEQLILGELIAQQIENKTHLAVERRFYLAGTLIAHQDII